MAALTAPHRTARPGPPRPHPLRGGRRGRAVRRNLSAHGFLIGAVLCFGLFSWYPMVREIIMAFQRTRRGETTWVGWQNLVHIWHDPAFWQAWRNTAYFTILAEEWPTIKARLQARLAG